MVDGEAASKANRPSESMMRITRLFRANKLRPDDSLTYKIPCADGDYKYTAKFQPDGRIAKAKELSAPVSSDKDIGDAKWDSPTDFVNAMFDHAQARLPPKTRRGSLNGWAECYYDGKSLNDIFTGYLRERIAERNLEDEERAPSDTEKNPKNDGGTDDTKTPSKTTDEKAKNEDASPKKKKITIPLSSIPKEPAPSSKSSEPTTTTPKDPPAKHSPKNENKNDNGIVDHSSPKAERKTTEKEGSTPSKKEGPEGMTNKDQVERAELKDDAREENTKGENKNIEDGVAAMDTTVVDETDKAKNDNEKNVAPNTDEENKTEKREANKPDDGGNDGSLEKEGKEDAMVDADEVSEERETAAAAEVESSDGGTDSKASDCSTDPTGKNNKGSPKRRKHKKSQKRKRSITPQPEADRATRAKSRRRILDPEAAEAARVAAQADKLELKSLRPTTRLTSGKIPKVVYNASPRTMANEPSEPLADEPRASRKKESGRRTPRKRGKHSNTSNNADVDMEDADGASDRDGSVKSQDEEEYLDTEMEIEEKNDTINLLNELLIAVRKTGSTTPAVIVTELRGKSLSTEEARSFVTNMLDDIRRVNKLVGHESQDTHDMVRQMQAYIAAEIGRWENDKGPRRPSAVIKRRNMVLEKKRPVLEKKKRRRKRALDESLAKLEEQMEERRRQVQDASRVAYQLSVTRMELDNANHRRDAVKKKVEEGQLLENKLRERIERTRKSYNQLVSVAKSSRHNNSNKRRKVESDGAQGGGTVAEGKNNNNGEDARMKEIERLRRLVKAEGAKAEECQREAQVVYMEVRTMMDTKSRMENTIYRRKTTRNYAAKLLANGVHASNSNNNNNANAGNNNEMGGKRGGNSNNNNKNEAANNTNKKANGGRARGGGGRGGRRKKESNSNNNERGGTKNSRKGGRQSDRN